MPDWVYLILLAFTLVSYAGLIPLLMRARPEEFNPIRRDMALLLTALFGLGSPPFVLQHLVRAVPGPLPLPGHDRLRHRDRRGWVGWTRLLAGRVRATWLRWTPALIMGGLAVLSAYALWRFIIPNLKAW